MFSLMMFSLFTLMVIISALALFAPGSGYDPEDDEEQEQYIRKWKREHREEDEDEKRGV